MANIMDENGKKQKKPKKTPRIKHKKLIILFTAILVVATVFVIKMFSTKHYALAEETDSFEMERPTSGNPLDYSGKDNAAICNWVIRHTTDFKTVTTGTVKAKVSVINYNQELQNTRIVTSDGCYIETISDSSLVHVYEEKYIEGDQVVVRKNHSDKYSTITKEVFLEKYGWHPRDFQAYILNEETIKDAQIEAFDNNYKLTLTLDPVSSSPKKQRETKTIGNAKGYPGYKETVLTVILTSDWTPIEVDTYEVYDIGMPGIGDVTCKCNMVEIFEYGVFDIPDKATFKQHITDSPTNDIEVEKETIGYLQEVFGPLIQGNMNDFEITIEALDTTLNGNLNLSLSDGIKVNADIDGIFVSYEGDNVFIKLGDNKYKVNIKEIQSQLGNSNTSSLNKALNLMQVIDQVNNAEIIENGNTLTIKMNLELMGIKASADISAEIKNDTYYFKDIYAKVDIMGEEIILTMKPSEKYNYPTVDETYEDITDITFIVDEVKGLIDKPVEVTLDTQVEGISISASAIYNNGLASGNITINDNYEINFYYNNETIYLTYNNLYFKFNINDINEFTNEPIKLDVPSGVEVKLSEILDIIKTLNIKMLSSSSVDISIDLARYSELLKDAKININKTESLNLVVEKYNLALSIKVTTKEALINPDVEYNDIKNVKWLIDVVKEVITYDAYNFDIDLTYNDLTVKGNVYLDKDLNVSAVVDLKYKDYEINNVKLEYVDSNIYVSFYNIKVKATLEEVISLVGEMPEFDIDKLLENLFINLTNESVGVTLDLSSFDGLLNKLGNAVIAISDNKKVNITTDLFKSSITLTGVDKKEITVDDTDYISLESISWLIDDIKAAVEYDTYNFNINLTYKDLTVTGNIYLNKDLEIKANLDVNYSGLLLNDIELMFKNNDIYVSFGQTSIKLNISDIEGIISEINSAFGLDISTDSLNVDFDLITIISSIKLNSTTDKVLVSVDLTSISSMLGKVDITIEKNFKATVSTKDILVNATLSNSDYEEVVLPDADINPHEISLLIEYAKQLKDVVEKWRYHIGFELHVNGYDVYADVNIVTNKPNPGLALYGKVILFKGSKQYYIEASILQELVGSEIRDIAYLKFSQTISNVNKTNPIKSTTNQYINFKIDFDELIDVANYAVDKLGIDNDTIKMAINYLGTIVNTNGDFDEIFNDVKEKVTSIDLTMINDFIDLSNIKVLVDNDNLTINLGKNKENNTQTLSIFREDGVIKGLNTSEFEINHDILNSHFELLENQEITNANYSGCLNLTGIGNLIKAGLNNYNNGEIALSGTVNLELDIPVINIFGKIKIAGVKIEAKIDFDFEGKIRGYVYLKMPKVLLATNAETESYIYIQNDMIYIKRVAKSTETRKMTLSDFGKDAMEEIIWICNFADAVANAIRDAQAVDPKIEEVLKSYSGKNNSYNVTLDGEKLVGSSAFGDINLSLTTTTINDELYLNIINFDTTIVSLIDISGELKVINSSIDWTFFPSQVTLENYTLHTI